MLRTILLGVLLLSPEVSLADCLDDAIFVRDARITELAGEHVTFEAEIENRSRVTLGGALVAVEVWASDRPTPIGIGTLAEARIIAGGLEPGEHATFEGWAYVGERGAALLSSSSAQNLVVDLENAATHDMVAFRDEPHVGGWHSPVLGSEPDCENSRD